MIIVIVVLFLVLLMAGIFYTMFLINKNKKAQEEENEKYIHTTQDQLPFEFIRKGIAKLKNGTYTKIIEVSSINTPLMEMEEEENVREIYGSILNAINFNIQFYKQSRLVDIREYLTFLSEKENLETNEFKKNGIERYRYFISHLVRENSVQTKKDYIAISFVEEKKKKEEQKDETSKYRKREDVSLESDETFKRKKEFKKAHKTLNQRMKTLDKQFRRLGIVGNILEDKELFELFYTTYNKDRSNIQSLKDVEPSDYTTLYIKRGE